MGAESSAVANSAGGQGRCSLLVVVLRGAWSMFQSRDRGRKRDGAVQSLAACRSCRGNGWRSERDEVECQAGVHACGEVKCGVVFQAGCWSGGGGAGAGQGLLTGEASTRISSTITLDDGWPMEIDCCTAAARGVYLHCAQHCTASLRSGNTQTATGSVEAGGRERLFGMANLPDLDERQDMRVGGGRESGR